jgi:excisionase family DNA binding protein
MVSTDELRRVSPWMDTGEAARYLGAKSGTLKNWRHRGEGPRYHVVNRRLIRYHVNELDEFVKCSAQGA